jgi:hypothetical protein
MKRRTRKDEDEEMDREAVARRAYDLFLKRGSIPGRDMEDWLEAERQLRQERKRKPVRKKAEAQLA